MGFTSIPQTLINVGKALVQPLFQYLKDNDDYLYSKIGSIEGSGVLNGSFEIDSDRDDRPDLWSLNLYPGGAGGLAPSEVIGTNGLNYACIADHTAADTNKPITGASWSSYWSQNGSNGTTWVTSKKYRSQPGAHAARCVWFEHPGGVGNGGGYLESDYLSAGLSQKILTFAYKCSVASIKVVCEILWYDKDKLYLSSTTAWNRSADNPLRWAMVMLNAIPVPVNARFLKIRFIGGATDVNVAGTVWFDNVEFVGEPQPAMTPLTESINQAQVSTTSASYVDIGTAWIINIPSTVGALLVEVEVSSVDLYAALSLTRMRIGAVYSNEVSTTGPYYQNGILYLNVESLSGTQTLRFQLRSSSTSATAYMRSPSSLRRNYTGRGFIADIMRNLVVERSVYRNLSGSSAWWGTDNLCPCQCTCICQCQCTCQCTCPCTSPTCG